MIDHDDDAVNALSYPSCNAGSSNTARDTRLGCYCHSIIDISPEFLLQKLRLG